ncbi:MAG: hypothetical protein GWO04_47965, partial [Actinobacteria bacterium]|nr:hypothetical protein [Actinomycetota bacterium]
MRRAWWIWAALALGCGDDGGADPGDMSACMADLDCDDGVFCNGTESCDPTAPAADANGCVNG